MSCSDISLLKLSHHSGGHKLATNTLIINSPTCHVAVNNVVTRESRGGHADTMLSLRLHQDSIS